MGKVKRPRPIRLTNRTAVGLRKSAQRVRSAWLVAMCVMTMLFTVLAVYLGFSWLPAVPLTLIFGGIIIVLMMIISRSQYLLLISQAICTEAASRQMEERRSEQHRRQKAIEQLAAMRADVREAQKNGMVREGFRGEESLLFDLLTGREESEEDVYPFRRGEEDEEMFSSSYTEEENAHSDDEEDLYPPKKDKRAVQAAPVMPSSSGNTRPMMKTIKAEAPAIRESADEEENGARRRRRRSAPVNTASLQLIKNNQAQ
ncbi:MAG: hypothetical protein IKV90_09460 [Clostridia bacterium]|nr:hypothetical protein [Clostridia bacterium]